MLKRRSRSAMAFSFVLETLESRVVLSGTTAAQALHPGTAIVAAQNVHHVATKTTLAVTAGTLGQPVSLAVTVRAGSGAGAPSGTVNIIDRGQVIGSVKLSPSTSSAKAPMSHASINLSSQPGGGAYYFGAHPITATFVPSGPFLKSSASKSFTVSMPASTTLAGGVKVATIVNGAGPAIQAGQTASVLYTGYLASTGQIFDDSLNDGGAPLRFTIGAGQVVPGFESGTAGMKVGETRIVQIPPDQGYGATANGPIPANSALIFVITLTAIS